MAFVTVNRQQLKRLAPANKNARRLLRLKENPERTLSVIQIGITLVGAIAAAVGGAGAEEALSPWLMQKFNASEQTAEAIAIAMVVLPISFLSVVVGELVPKTLALRNPLTIALWTSQGLYVGEKLLSPAVNILERSTNVVLRLFTFGQHHPSQKEVPIELEDLPQQTKQYVVNLVSADKKIAREIMLPWDDVIFVRKTDSLEDVETIIINSRHTRLPVLNDSEEVVGLINTKEFLTVRRYGESEWQRMIRPILRFKSFEPLFRILLKMQKQKSHMAVIYDQTKPTGLITMEDIFEEIIGDVFDEDDDGLMRKILSSKSRRRLI